MVELHPVVNRYKFAASSPWLPSCLGHAGHGADHASRAASGTRLSRFLLPIPPLLPPQEEQGTDKDHAYYNANCDANGRSGRKASLTARVFPYGPIRLDRYRLDVTRGCDGSDASTSATVFGLT